MGKAKDRLLKEHEDGSKEYELNDFEFKFVRDLNNALVHNVYREHLVSALLTYICITRFGYDQAVKDNKSLQFQIDLAGEDRILTVIEADK